MKLSVIIPQFLNDADIQDQSRELYELLHYDKNVSILRYDKILHLT